VVRLAFDRNDEVPTLRTTSLLLSVIISSIVVASPAWAGIINGGFEAGDFTGWSVAGDALVVTSAIGVAPPEGAFQALVTTSSQLGDSSTFSGTSAVPVADLETFLGVSSGTIGSGFEGSAVQQTFTVAVGDVLTFQYKFLTTEGNRNDFAFVNLAGYARLADTTAADLVPSAVVLDPVFGDPTRETGWRTFSHAFAADGTFTLGIGVADAIDEFIPSGLIVDDVRLLTAGPVIAEPTSLVLLAIGGAGAAFLSGRRSRRSQVRVNDSGVERESGV